MIKNKTKNLLILISILIVFSFSSAVFASNSVGSIDPSHPYAWGNNLGWINFGCTTGCNASITDTAITGYVWSREYGWINLSPANSGGGVTNNCSGQLGGNAWSSKLGWIDFTGASIDYNGKFSGITETTANKSGRISFDCDHCNVQTDWRQCAQRASPPQVLIYSITNNIIPSIPVQVIK